MSNRIPDYTRENLYIPPKDRRDFYRGEPPAVGKPVVPAPVVTAPVVNEPAPVVEEKVEEKVQEVVEPVQAFKCDECGREFKTEHGLKVHGGACKKKE